MPVIPLNDLCQSALNIMRPGDGPLYCAERERDGLIQLKAKWPSTPELVRQACLRFDAYSTISECIDDLLPKYRDEAWRKLQGR